MSKIDDRTDDGSVRPLPSMSDTKLRSIFNSCRGSDDKYASEVWPQPKSSRLTRIPINSSVFKISIARSGIDNQSRFGDLDNQTICRRRRERSRHAVTLSGNLPSLRLLAETFTATATSKERLSKSESALSNTQSVRPKIRSVCSARGMNSSGKTSPFSGCCHRTSASTALIAPSPRFAFG